MQQVIYIYMSESDVKPVTFHESPSFSFKNYIYKKYKNNKNKQVDAGTNI